jgi:hypothetical protein
MLFLLTVSLAEAIRVMFQAVLCGCVHSNTVTGYYWPVICHSSRVAVETRYTGPVYSTVSCGIEAASSSVPCNFSVRYRR